MSGFYQINEIYNTYPLNYRRSIDDEDRKKESDDTKTEVYICVITDLHELHQQNGSIDFLYKKIDEQFERLRGYSHLSFQFSAHIRPNELTNDKKYHLLYRLLGSECIWSQLYREDEYYSGYEEYQKMKIEDENSEENQYFEQVVINRPNKQHFSASYYIRNEVDQLLNYTDKSVRLVYIPVYLKIVNYQQFCQFLEHL